MKTNVWDIAAGGKAPRRAHKARRRSVAAILRDAYRLHAVDRVTKRAVKGCIR
jgi:hypothetical protein